MEITGIRCIQLEGAIPSVDTEAYYESRVAAPLDVYEEFNQQSIHDTNVDGIFPSEEDGETRLTQLFLLVDTDEGVTGLAGPIDRTTAYLALELEDFLVGRDPRLTEKLWDLMYRKEVHGRKGRTMMAISAIDIALWDVKGKYYDEPIYRLLGGPTREELRAYGSMYLYSVDPADARETAAEFADRGFDAQKWFLRHGPGSGHEGMQRNEALVAAVRDATSDEYDLMFDAWSAWDRAYALEMVDRLAPYDPTWVEEVILPDKIDQMAEITEAAPFPIAGGEHEYTRWGFHELLSRDALDVLQPDTLWAGGITELDKICTLASVHDVPVNPHGMSVPANIQIIASQSPTTCPFVEYLTRLNTALQHFFEDPIEAEDGVVTVPERPGLGVSIDRSKVERETEVTF